MPETAEHQWLKEHLHRKANWKKWGPYSNGWGPIRFPINYLLIESLQKFHHYYGDALQVECPTGSGRRMTVDEVATELSRRLIVLFRKDEADLRAIYDGNRLFQHDPHWEDYILINEYFHDDNGAELVAKLIQQAGR